MSRSYNKQGHTRLVVGKPVSKTSSPARTASPSPTAAGPVEMIPDLRVLSASPVQVIDTTYFGAPGDKGWKYFDKSEFYIQLLKNEEIRRVTPSEFFELNLGQNLDLFCMDYPLFFDYYILRHEDNLVPVFPRSDGTYRYGATDTTWLNFERTGLKVEKTEFGFCIVDKEGERMYNLDIYRAPKKRLKKHRRDRSSDSYSSRS